MSKLESFASLSAKTVAQVKKLAWPNGAIMTCGVCLTSKQKTPEEMNRYLKRWPKCCNVPVSVKPL